MTADEALGVIADMAVASGTPSDSSSLAKAGKALHDEIERLRELAYQEVEGVRLVWRELAGRALNEIDRLTAKIDRLRALVTPIPCNERLPEGKGSVQAWDSYNGIWAYESGSIVRSNTSQWTHWLPLPATP